MPNGIPITDAAGSAQSRFTVFLVPARLANHWRNQMVADVSGCLTSCPLSRGGTLTHRIRLWASPITLSGKTVQNLTKTSLFTLSGKAYLISSTIVLTYHRSSGSLWPEAASEHCFAVLWPIHSGFLRVQIRSLLQSSEELARCG